ncbi:MAG: DUF167 domain-containing protein [Isosphaerales bacterium]
MISLSPHADGVILPVLAQAGARRNAILGERAGALRVAVTAPPEKGKANEAIQSVLAEALACKTKQVTLLFGATSRQKRFLIGGITLEGLSNRLAKVVPATKS